MAVLYGNLDEAQNSAEEALRIARAAGYRYLISVMNYPIRRGGARMRIPSPFGISYANAGL